MNFYMTFKHCGLSNTYAKILLRLKLTFIILTTVILQVSATGFAQITLKEKSAPLEQIIQKIRKQAGYDFFYNAGMLAKAKPVTLNVTNASVEEVLELCFKNQPLTYTIDQKTIVVKYSTLPEANSLLPIIVTGKIFDEDGKPIPGASIRIKGVNTKAAVSIGDGSFKITVNSEDDVLVITYIGFKTKEVPLKGNKGNLTIRMELSETAMKDVVVTGMMTRKKETFTGATASFSGEELKNIGNVNIIQSLRTLDPSFLLMENNMSGSNPNSLPVIELRGRTSITTQGLKDEFSADPNQPLFILDGFETTLQNIVNLDVNRVASVTILKDAASTAIYGSRASNGVVVVETIQPKAGEIIINYTTDGNIEIPDLSSYNMMNSKEKVEFERLSGRYTINPRWDKPIKQLELDSLYSYRLKQVNRGVDSYWLSDPLRTGYSQRHSLMVSGGSGAVTFGVGVDYRKANGVMKGSGKDTWGTRLNLTYRNGKFNANNTLYINGYTANESPYGLFSTWVNTNPYYEKAPADQRYLAVLLHPYGGGGAKLEYVSNPLYDASLSSFDRKKNYLITNNLQLRYDISPDLRLTSALQVSKGNTTSQQFISALANKFAFSSFLEKGSLSSTVINNSSYTANIALNYGKTIEKHLINAIFRAEISNKNDNKDGYLATGFPNASNGNPRFAYGYAEGKTPQASQSITRRNSLVANLNYSYDRKYNMDASFTYDGSTAFGQQNLYSPFYSVGVSWNINNEAFMKDQNWINLLRLRGNIGVTGNQNFSSFTSVTTYDYDSYYNYSGQGVSLSSLGNSDLKWQNTVQTSVGVDAAFFKNRLTATLSAYRKYTDPLVVAVTLPPSTALNDFPLNAGDLTVNGAEMNLRFSPIYRISDRIIWTLGLTGSSYKQKYNHFNNVLEKLNDNLRKSKSLIRFRDGADPDDLWTVPSLGIDPGTGREIFLKRDGTYSFEYDYNDQIVVGNKRPTMEGVLSSNLTYKGFSLGLSFRYITGQDIFNQALYNKVENISMKDLINNNQDKRALYDRWKQEGQVAEFKAIALTDYYGTVIPTEMSSRFVQREHSVSLESASLGYEFRDFSWMKKARLSNLRLTGYTNDIFNWSTIKRERGIEYPYARTISFSLSANFQ